MRYAIISDIHGNLPALTSVFDDLEQRNVDTIICLGDVVGYYADSHAVIAYLRDRLREQPYQTGEHTTHGPLWLSGNHEYGLLNKISTQNFSEVARMTLDQTRRELSEDAQAFLASLPQTIDLQLTSELCATFVHATPSDPVGVSGYIESTEDARLAIEELRSQLCIVGHTHRPGIFHATNRTIGNIRLWKQINIGRHFPDSLATPIPLPLPAVINSGSVGQPRDGDNRASYGILDVTQELPTLTIYRVAYNIDETIKRIRSWLQDQPDTFWDSPSSLSQRLKQGL